MHTPLVALTWEFWARHRWGLAGVITLVIAYTLVCASAPFPQNIAAASTLWFVMGLVYVIVVFAYGVEGRLETAESGFPARLFVLPVRTGVLVGWPMVQGVLVAVLLWVVWDRLVLQPSGVESPAWATAMLAAVVAVSQAIVWLPFGLPWLRILVAIVVLTVMVRAPLFLALAGVSFADPDEESRVLVTVAVVLVPAAFLAAWSGVSRARRGDDPDWLRIVRSFPLARGAVRARPPFTSALRAQVWYEWRSRARGFVIVVGCTLVGFQALAILNQWRVGWHAADNLVFLAVPFVIAPFWGGYAGRTGEVGLAAPMTAFGATRPLNNTALVLARFLAAGLAALAAWALVVSVVSGWLLATGGQKELSGIWEGLVVKYGFARACVGSAVVAVGSVGFTWRMLVVGQWAGLTGRVWVGIVSMIVILQLGFQGLYELAMWNVDPARRERVLDVLPWIASIVIAVKVVVAGVSLRSLHRRGEVTARTVRRLLAVWSLLAAGAFGLLVWLVPSGRVPVYGLAFGVVLCVPLARVVGAPLALAWNRHR